MPRNYANNVTNRTINRRFNNSHAILNVPLLLTQHLKKLNCFRKRQLLNKYFYYYIHFLPHIKMAAAYFFLIEQGRMSQRPWHD